MKLVTDRNAGFLDRRERSIKAPLIHTEAQRRYAALLRSLSWSMLLFGFYFGARLGEHFDLGGWGALAGLLLAITVRSLLFNQFYGIVKSARMDDSEQFLYRNTNYTGTRDDL